MWYISHVLPQTKSICHHHLPDNPPVMTPWPCDQSSFIISTRAHQVTTKLIMQFFLGGMDHVRICPATCWSDVVRIPTPLHG